jgi:hypothetical protein
MKHETKIKLLNILLHILEFVTFLIFIELIKAIFYIMENYV